MDIPAMATSMLPESKEGISASKPIPFTVTVSNPAFLPIARINSISNPVRLPSFLSGNSNGANDGSVPTINSFLSAGLLLDLVSLPHPAAIPRSSTNIPTTPAVFTHFFMTHTPLIFLFSLFWVKENNSADLVFAPTLACWKSRS